MVVSSQMAFMKGIRKSCSSSTMISLVMSYLKNEIFYVYVYVLENGSDMVITIIFHLLKEFLEDHQKFPKNLHLNLGIVFYNNNNNNTNNNNNNVFPNQYKYTADVVILVTWELKPSHLR